MAFVLGGESLITAAVYTMASSFIAITFKAGSSGAAGTVSADQLLNENTRNNNNHNNNLYQAKTAPDPISEHWILQISLEHAHLASVAFIKM